MAPWPPLGDRHGRCMACGCRRGGARSIRATAVTRSPIRSLDRGSVYVLQRYRLTDSQDFGLVEERRVSADELRIANALPPPALGLLTLRRADETRDASSPTRRARTAVQR